MYYYRQSDNSLLSCSAAVTADGTVELTEDEYNRAVAELEQLHPEELSLPQAEDEATVADYEQALADLGVRLV